jgi:DNA-binding transcriptional ArsR family regulator
MQSDQLSAVLAALAEPTRRAIVVRLARGEATVSELAEPFDIAMPGISKHLAVLKAAGLVVQTRDGRRRPCRLNPEPMRELAQWAEMFRANWELSYSRLDDYLQEVQESRRTGHGDAL